MPANNPHSVSLRLTTGQLIAKSGDESDDQQLATSKSGKQSGGFAASFRRTYHCRFVRAGRVRAAGGHPSNIEITPQALQTAWDAGLFNGKAVFIDHAALWEYLSLENLVGVTQASIWNEAEGAIEGAIKLYSNNPGTSITVVNSVDASSDELLTEDGDIVVITVDYDGATGTAAADLTVVLTFTEE
jgi:hypothetical protein